MIYSIMGVICTAVILYFCSCLIVNHVAYEDEDTAVGKTMILLGGIYLLGLVSGWWTV